MMDTVEKLKTQRADYKALYEELLLAVHSTFPGETRHQTALRYIREAEQAANTCWTAQQQSIGAHGFAQKIRGER